jgi:hypothetical protein
MSNTLQYLTDDQGRRTAVVLPISDYEELMEDLDDLAVIAERRDEPTIPHQEFIGDPEIRQQMARSEAEESRAIPANESFARLRQSAPKD